VKCPQTRLTLGLRAFSWILLSTMASSCTVEPTTSIQDRAGAGTHTVIDSEWYNACHGYCAQMYDEPEGCDEDQVEIEATACHMYCDLGPDALTEPCRTGLIDAYNCVIEQEVRYICASAEASPQPVELECGSEWDAANTCQ
jgi:hypothetical protein